MTATAEAEPPIILFDGVCPLCTSTVQFVIARDPHKTFRFAPLQSPLADRLLGGRSDDPARLDTMVLIEGGRVYRKSSAALRTVRRLTGLWPLLSIFLIVPRPLRDLVYDLVAGTRYRLFGRRDACWTPSSDLADRFLD